MDNNKKMMTETSGNTQTKDAQTQKTDKQSVHIPDMPDVKVLEPKLMMVDDGKTIMLDVHRNLALPFVFTLVLRRAAGTAAYNLGAERIMYMFDGPRQRDDYFGALFYMMQLQHRTTTNASLVKMYGEEIAKFRRAIDEMKMHDVER